MRNTIFTGLLLLTFSAHAQATRHEPLTAPDNAVPLAGEKVLLPSLKGIVLITDTGKTALQREAQGVDLSSVPIAQTDAIRSYLERAIGRPATLSSLHRLAEGISHMLLMAGHGFVSVWLPPQDLTSGVVRIVARPAVADGPVHIVGAKYFSPESYLTWVRQKAGAPIDIAALQEDIDWINRNPDRNATLVAQPGSAPGSTRLGLRVREQNPLNLSAGYDNSGAPLIGTHRIFAGFTWGNAFGRGDQMSYQYRVDPRRNQSVTHSASYNASLPWRDELDLSADWSSVKPDLGPYLNEKGTNWQVGARYIVPLRQQSSAWNNQFSTGFDYKYANNNLLFSTIPVFNNVTHIVQAMLGCAISHAGASGGQSSLSSSLVLSPGGLASHNDNASFDGSRAGAHARYAYLHLDGTHYQPLAAGFALHLRGSAQISNVALLGSEQLSGGGAGAVRGYNALAAYGDSGGVLNAELHFPGFGLAQTSAAVATNVDAFVFYDAASLHNNGVNSGNIQLSSVGIGASMRIGRHGTLNFSEALPRSPLPTPNSDQRMQFSFQMSF